ncbi:MAG: motility protein MotB [Burkholderiales bacterium]|nr:MAG: motility protein MotB [Burkholderiales bacterium]
MAAADKKIQPIIIKKIKKGGHGHHGGAWKIAYADFVTAMMAFFLLMWLLGSTTKGDLKGIADHFSTPLQVAMFGGSGSGDSSSIIRGGGEDLTRTTGQVKRGDVEQPKAKVNLQQLPEEMQKMTEAQARKVRALVEEAIERNPRLRELRNQVRMDVTPDGLRIQIVDDQNRPMFDSGSAVVKPYMRELLGEIARALNEVDARVTLTGHTDTAPFSGGERGYSNWELSADRANASRRELLAAGMDERKILRVMGLAAVVPFDQNSPGAPINRRISIVVMNSMAERRVLSGTELQASDIQEFEKALSRVPGLGGSIVPGPPVLVPPVQPGAAAPAGAAAVPAAPAAEAASAEGAAAKR